MRLLPYEAMGAAGGAFVRFCGLAAAAASPQKLACCMPAVHGKACS
jgi:hypothetical protein